MSNPSQTIKIINGVLVNEGRRMQADVLIKGGRIARIASQINDHADVTIDARDKWVMPGAIDDQVHFREPGLTHKAEIYTEAKAAVAGGVTTFMEMPNTVPQALTQSLLQDKYNRAAEVSLANYSFYMGASNDNLEEVLKTDPSEVCGIKVFMGSSTGNMLVDDAVVLEKIFSNAEMLVATHCEDEATISNNMASWKATYGDDIPIREHPNIRSEKACYLSSSLAVDLATKHDTRLHVLHISTEKETALFRNDIHRSEKRITAEACIHHLWFDDSFYDEKQTLIKWNPAVKKASDRDGIWKALLDGRIDVVATDHAPHTLEEKQNVYTKAPSGGPLVQHSLVAMLEKAKEGKITVEQVVDKMAHAVADCFQIKGRGYLREGYYADVVIVDPQQPWTVSKENLEYKCRWSPFEGQRFSNSITHTIVSGKLVYQNGAFDETTKGQRLQFDR